MKSYSLFNNNKIIISFCISFFCFQFYVNSLVAQEIDSTEEKEISRIMSIYNNEGENNLKIYIESYIDDIKDNLIIKLASTGEENRDEDELKAAVILAKRKNNKKTLAKVYYHYVYYLVITGQIENLKYDVDAIRLYTELGDSLGIGKIYHLQGASCFFKGDDDNALRLYLKALPFFKTAKSYVFIGILYRCMGDIYLKEGKLDSALYVYEDALKYSEKVNDFTGMGNIYERLSTIYSEKGKHNKAIELLFKALSFLEKTKEPIGQGNVYFRLGVIYSVEKKLDKAMELYLKALPFYEIAKEPFGQGNVYYRIGELSFYKGEYNKAVEMYSKALLFYKMGNEPLSLGNIYQKLGNIYFNEGKISKAIEIYLTALNSFQLAKDPLSLGNLYIDFGDLYVNINDLDKAIETYSKALPLFKTMEEPVGQGTVYKCLGEAYLRQDSLTKALDMFLKALPFFDSGNEPMGKGDVFKDLGKTYLCTNNFDKALEMLSQALNIYETAGYKAGRALIYRLQGDAFFKNSKITNAIDKYKRAEQIFEEINIPEELAYLYISEADIYSMENKIDCADSLYVKGISLLENIRTNTGFTEMKISFMEKLSDYYEHVILFMLQNNRENKALYYSEAIKARAFLDQIAEKKGCHLDKGINPEFRVKKDSLTSKLSSIKAFMISASNTNETIDSLRKEYNNISDELEKLVQEIRYKNPLYASIKYPKTINAEEVQKILEPKEAMIEYFLSSKGVYAFIITNENLHTVKLPTNLVQIEKESNKYCKNLTSIYNTEESKLYEMLIKPVEAYIKDKSELVIVPEGVLTTLPFEAVIVGTNDNQDRPEYLIEKYSIKYIQSAAVLAFTRENKNEVTKNSFAGFGDPVYDYDNYSKGKSERGERIKKDEQEEFPVSFKGDQFWKAGGALNRLEKSGEEVEEISKFFKDSKLYRRMEANEENVKRVDMKQYGYILLSCHGLIDDDFQSLVLSQIPGSKEDGYLTLDEIMNLDWDANLVVFSACKSGKGKIKRGEGMISLTRAVMYAGTTAAVVSLWNVDENGTKELIVDFFRYLKERNSTKEEALRNAKLEMLKSKYNNPFYWSAFVMYGE